jgi:hypothetical protein
MNFWPRTHSKGIARKFSLKINPKKLGDGADKSSALIGELSRLK